MSKNYIESNILEYNNIKDIYGFKCDVVGETSETYFIKEFRYSTDKILWSDYKELSEENLAKVFVDNTLYIQYRFTKVGDGDLDVKSISLNINFTSSNTQIPDCHWMTLNSPKIPTIVYNNSAMGLNLFNPYNITPALGFYSQMSRLVSNMFGFCVLYFKTEANATSRDVVLKEYSIEKVIDKQNVKILVPDNQLPTRELQFNTMMIDYPVQFEIHIVKAEFQSVFGADAHPDPHDYLYFSNYMNKMYMVDSVADPDDFGYLSTYWRISLVPYQEMTSVKFEDEDLQLDTESLIFSSESKFGDDTNDELMDIRKDNQLNDVGDLQQSQDRLRRTLDPNVRINNELIYNNWTIVSKQHYNLSTMLENHIIKNITDKNNLISCEYTYCNGFNYTDERMVTFLFRPHNKYTPKKLQIETTEKVSNGVRLKVKFWDNNIQIGNYVQLSKVTDISGFRKIISVTRSRRTLIVDAEYTRFTKQLLCASIEAIEINDLISVKDEKGNIIFKIMQSPYNIYIELKNTLYKYTFDNFKQFENKWYGVVIGFKNGLSNIWLYEFKNSESKENVRSCITNIGFATNDLGQFDLGETCYYDIMSGYVDFTNFRLWKKISETDKHNLLLSQYLIDDTHNTLIVDNAMSELLLNYKWS